MRFRFATKELHALYVSGAMDPHTGDVCEAFFGALEAIAAAASLADLHALASLAVLPHGDGEFSLRLTSTARLVVSIVQEDGIGSVVVKAISTVGRPPG